MTTDDEIQVIYFSCGTSGATVVQHSISFNTKEHAVQAYIDQVKPFAMGGIVYTISTRKLIRLLNSSAKVED